METGVPERLAGWDIHGFLTMEDLDIRTIMEEARTRWLRPNEIHAILCNKSYFSISVKPVNLPPSGTIVLFDRKMLRNFRKDGHNWKKKKDGKTVKEAHEHLKVGNEERIHVYYAHGQDNPTFVRRCYWLLDKTLEHIVLVHYRETRELQGSPVTPVNSNSNSGISDLSAPCPLSEETDSTAARASYADHGENIQATNYERRIHEINTLEWEELLETNYHNSAAPKEDDIARLQQRNQHISNGSKYSGIPLLANSLPAEISSHWNLTSAIATNDSTNYNISEVASFPKLGGQVSSDVDKKDSVTVGIGGNSLDILVQDGLQTQDSFGRWMNSVMIDSPGSVDDSLLESSISSSHGLFVSPVIDHQQSSVPENIFCITDVSPAWAFSSEKTKVLVTGYFYEKHAHLAKSNLFCVCGDICVPAEIVQVGVFRCFVSPHAPGLVNLYLSLDGNKSISQAFIFEFRTPLLHESVVSIEDKFKWDEFRVQMRLAQLLFSKSKSLNVLPSKVSQSALKEAKKYALKTSHITSSWEYLIKAIEENKISFPQARESLFELALRNRLQEWLLERIIEGRKITDYDDQGQGVIHLCAILGYAWAVYLFSLSGLSLDYRDKFGWTALHWAAYCGREKMVAVLLSAGAKPNLVNDPTPENPAGCTAADFASQNGYDGLAGYLAEKALVQHFRDMTIAGNVSGSLQIDTTDPVKNENISEEELYLKDTLAAYRTAADAAARIQTAFREHSLKLQTNAVQSSNPESEAQTIIAALKIQHAFRNYETRKQIKAAARIQHRFRTWKIRKEFLDMRRHTIKIQAIFRGYQVRKHYNKILWSVGVLEKAVLRWRLKRKGFRGLQVDPVEEVADQTGASYVEEDFFRASRKQAEERVESAVVKVQAMFRSKKAQEDYRSMKLAHNQAKLEFEGFLDPDTNMDNWK